MSKWWQIPEKPKQFFGHSKYKISICGRNFLQQKRLLTLTFPQTSILNPAAGAVVPMVTLFLGIIGAWIFHHTGFAELNKGVIVRQLQSRQKYFAPGNSDRKNTDCICCTQKMRLGFSGIYHHLLILLTSLLDILQPFSEISGWNLSFEISKLMTILRSEKK